MIESDSNDPDIDGPTQNEEYWYCVHTKPREERFADIHLTRQGFETFLPYIRQKKLYRRKLQWITAPMFSRYLFVRVPYLEDLSKIRSTRGVSQIVTFGDTPTSVPVTVIAEVRGHCENDVLTIEDAEFSPGECVEILCGPYQGMTAIFDRDTSNKERVIILLEIMASVARVEVNREILEKER